MNKLIQFTYQTSELEYILIELQGTVSHTAEKSYYFMFLGNLTKVTQVSYKK